MDRNLYRVAGAATVVVVALGCKPGLLGTRKITYPEAHVASVVESFHGTPVPDPYRWLEDIDSTETRSWIKAENKVTFSYLESIDGRRRIRDRLTQLWNYERYGVPFKEGGHYFFTRNDGLQPQSVLYVTDKLDAEPRQLLDPNAFSSDGTVALSGLAVSHDGRYLAYSTSSGGSDWQEWRVRGVGSGHDLEDHLKWVKFSGASWSADDTGFYYSRFDQPEPGQELKAANRSQKVYFHRLGTSQNRDRLIYERPDHDDWTFDAEVSDDGHYLIITVFKGTDRRNLLFYLDLQSHGGTVVELVSQFEAGYHFVGNQGPVFFLWTDLDAPNARLVAVDTQHPERAAWEEIIPEAEDALRSVSLVGDTLIASYLKDAHSRIAVFTASGGERGDLQLPGIGTAYGFQGHQSDVETFYAFTSFTTPGTVYHLDVTTLKSSVFRRPNVAFDPDNYVTEQYFCTSKDCTRVPIFVTHRKGLKDDGVNPTLLYGYGGFDISLTPRFSVSHLVWLEMGGVYAVASLRGGGEYGESWHRAGMLKDKQNVFNDFISSAEWLIDSRFTSPKKLAISGSSNGGLLVGAVLNQRPDLFGAALPDVGVMDMLRFNKFTIGWAWTSEYGSPEDPAMFPVLRAYSPYHNIKPGTYYPATLITTADHDDRVFPAHSFKYAARLQAAQGGPAPVLIRIETRAGHGAGKPTAKRIAEAADSLAFLAKNLDVAVPTWSPDRP